VLVKVTWMVLLVMLVLLVVLLAMRVFAWAGRGDPIDPAAARMSRMPQASTTHADLVRTRMVPSLSFLRISAERCRPGAERAKPAGKERN
jgi:hypothetical protein